MRGRAREYAHSISDLGAGVIGVVANLAAAQGTEKRPSPRSADYAVVYKQPAS
jgi:hypothetical protein